VTERCQKQMVAYMNMIKHIANSTATLHIPDEFLAGQTGDHFIHTCMGKIFYVRPHKVNCTCMFLVQLGDKK